jgi:hypothetical protein
MDSVVSDMVRSMEKMPLQQTVLSLVGGALAVTFFMGYLPTELGWLLPLGVAALYAIGAYNPR